MKNPNALPKLDFNVTNRCNLRCIHCCFQSGERKMAEFSCKKIEDTLRAFKELGGWRIDVTGGEPKMRNDLDRILRLAIRNFGLKTELVTNSLLLTPEDFAFYKNLGLQGVAISVDGSNSEIHGRIRGISERDYQQVLRNIKRSADAGIYTKVNTVVFSSNLHDLVNITKLAIDLGAKEHGLYFFSPIGRGESSGAEVADPLAWLKVIRKELAKFESRIKLSPEVPLIESDLVKNMDTRCFLQNPWHLQVLPNGNLYPCAIMAAYDIPIGNLHEKSLKNIWESEELWNEGYYRRNVEPFMKKYSSCVAYPNFSRLVDSGKYKFICLCKKLKIEEVCQ